MTSIGSVAASSPSPTASADALRQQRLLRVTEADEAHACSKTQVARWRDPRDATAERMAAWLVSSAVRDMAVDDGMPADAA